MSAFRQKESLARYCFVTYDCVIWDDELVGSRFWCHHTSPQSIWLQFFMHSTIVNLRDELKIVMFDCQLTSVYWVV